MCLWLEGWSFSWCKLKESKWYMTHLVFQSTDCRQMYRPHQSTCNWVACAWMLHMDASWLLQPAGQTKESEWISHQNSKKSKLEENQKEIRGKRESVCACVCVCVEWNCQLFLVSTSMLPWHLEQPPVKFSVAPSFSTNIILLKDGVKRVIL